MMQTLYLTISVQGYCFSMKRKGIKYFLLGFFFLSPLLNTAQKVGQQTATMPPIDIVFCFDLSGSTNGIIEHLRNNLWHFVHELEELEPVPDYRIGFIGFSRPSFGKEYSYVKVIRNLSYDTEWL